MREAPADMNVQAQLNRLGLDYPRAACILRINERTLRRYAQKQAVPWPVVHCLLAWEILRDAGMPWPGGGSRRYARQTDGSWAVSKESEQ